MKRIFYLTIFLGITFLFNGCFPSFLSDYINEERQATEAYEKVVAAQSKAKEDGVPQDLYCFIADNEFMYDLDGKKMQNTKLNRLDDNEIEKLIFCQDGNPQQYFKNNLSKINFPKVEKPKNLKAPSTATCMDIGYCDGDIVYVYESKILIRIYGIGGDTVRYDLYLTKNDEPIVEADYVFYQEFKMRRPKVLYNVYSPAYKKYQQNLDSINNKKNEVCKNLIKLKDQQYGKILLEICIGEASKM